jgi:hypothetical protein
MVLRKRHQNEQPVLGKRLTAFAPPILDSHGCEAYRTPSSALSRQTAQLLAISPH